MSEHEYIMDRYPWVDEENARRIAAENEIRRQTHTYDEAQRLKPR